MKGVVKRANNQDSLNKNDSFSNINTVHVMRGCQNVLSRIRAFIAVEGVYIECIRNTTISASV